MPSDGGGEIGGRQAFLTEGKWRRHGLPATGHPSYSCARSSG
jgi:hypothetical protein